MTLPVQDHLRRCDSGLDLNELRRGYGVNSVVKDGLAILNYDQLDAIKGCPVADDCRALTLRVGSWDVVARSFRRFYNLGERPDESLDWSSAVAQDKLDGCFLGNTALNLWGGGTVTIGEVVKKKLTPTLVGMDDTGELVPSKVTNWFHNGPKDNWLAVTIDCQVSRGEGAGGHPNVLRVTTNHSVYANGRFVAASELRTGDLMTTHDYQPSDEVLHVMRSGLLGDGSVCPNGRGWKYMDGHVADHAGYCDAIQNWLGECGINRRVVTSGYGSQIVQITSKAYQCLGRLREEWYGTGRRRVPEDLSWMDDFSVAKWYMDDGSIQHNDFQQDRAVFACSSKLRDEVDRLAAKLVELYGVSVGVTDSGRKGLILRVNAGRDGGIGRFWSAIAPHVVPVMRYKLPHEYRQCEYRTRVPGVEVCVPRTVSVLNVESIPVNKDNFPSGRTGFDISTETTNYFAKGVLVHNSLTVMFYTEKGWRVNTRGSFAEQPMTTGGPRWCDVFWKAFDADRLNIRDFRRDHAYSFELCTPWNQVVVYHERPSIHLLAAFDRDGNEMAEDEFPAGVLVPELFSLNSPESARLFVESRPGRSHEGVVVRDASGRRVKVKSTHYLHYHRLKNNGHGFSVSNLVPLILAGEGDEVAAVFPEASSRIRRMTERVAEEMQRARDVWDQVHGIESQKEFALAVIDRGVHPAVLFTARKNGRDFQAAWRSLAEKVLVTQFEKEFGPGPETSTVSVSDTPRSQTQ